MAENAPQRRCTRCRTLLTYKQRGVCDACLMASSEEMDDRELRGDPAPSGPVQHESGRYI